MSAYCPIGRPPGVDSATAWRAFRGKARTKVKHSHGQCNLQVSAMQLGNKPAGRIMHQAIVVFTSTMVRFSDENETPTLKTRLPLKSYFSA